MKSNASVNPRVYSPSVYHRYSPGEIELLHHALGHPAPGERCDDTTTHALATASHLHDLGLGAETAAAAALYVRLRAREPGQQDIDDDTPEAVAKLCRGLLRLGSIDRLGRTRALSSSERAERLKNLLLAVVKDVRVVIIELADRLEHLRHASNLPEAEGNALARSAIQIYAPLASRLGIWQFKWEIEDLAFRVLEPQTYRHIAKRLESRRSEREAYIDEVIATLRQMLAEEALRGEVSGRAKHIYGIAKKMRNKNVGFDEIFDALAVRILLPDVSACYAALGLVHGRWPPIRAEFDDYIARPKANGYQSLHTAVLGPSGRVVEVQIRTFGMHRQAEFGVAAHWRYKAGETDPANDAQGRAEWLRRMTDWADQSIDPEGAGGSVGAETAEASALLGERVYALTPAGDVIDLPEGATPLDFAYQVHTDVGHRCRGAKVNGAIVPLTHRLRSGDRVEILTTRTARPSRDWLNPSLGYLRAPRARAKVRQWFKQLDYEQNRSDGLQAFQREVSRLGVGEVDRAALVERLNARSFDDLMASLGNGDVTLGQLTGAIGHLLPPKPPSLAPTRRRARAAKAQGSGGVMIQGVGNLMTTVARCCTPVPPERIVGYVTRGRGVTVHRAECPNVLRLGEEDADRLIDVSWNTESSATYPANVSIEAYDRHGLLRDITTVVSAEQVNVTAIRSGDKGDDETVRIELALDVHSLTELARVLGRLRQITNVIEARANSASGSAG